MLFVNGEEIDIIFIEIFNFSFQLSKAWKSHSLAILFHKDPALFIGENVACFIRGNRFVFIMVGMWCDILDHDKFLSFLVLYECFMYAFYSINLP